MTQENRSQPNDDVADAAINQVLVAEQEAHAAIARASDEAREIIAKARERTRRIAERTDARISRLHAACQAWCAREVGARRAEAERVLACPVESDDRSRKLQAAIKRLAAELTGGAS